MDPERLLDVQRVPGQPRRGSEPLVTNEARRKLEHMRRTRHGARQTAQPSAVNDVRALQNVVIVKVGVVTYREDKRDSRGSARQRRNQRPDSMPVPRGRSSLQRGLDIRAAALSIG